MGLAGILDVNKCKKSDCTQARRRAADGAVAHAFWHGLCGCQRMLSEKVLTLAEKRHLLLHPQHLPHFQFIHETHAHLNVPMPLCAPPSAPPHSP